MHRAPTRSAPRVAHLALASALLLTACDRADTTAPRAAVAPVRPTADAEPAAGLTQGQAIFRFDTFGDETFWTDTARMHEVIRTSVSPNTALAVGLKVDVNALPPQIRAGIANGTVDLASPATTVTLLKLGAVLGVVGTVDAQNTLTRVGITCAFCHSTVDNSFAPGIGARLDGWPNRDLNVGAIIALSPAPTAAQKAVYQSWGPGKYDPRFNIDGKNLPVVIPPAFGLRRVAREIYTGDGVVSYWNDYVAITQMHGHGHFSDPRIRLDVNNPPELVAGKLAALRAYQFSLEAPSPSEIDPLAARRGRALFEGAARCATCHVGDVYTDVNLGRLHRAAEVGQSAAYALRSATERYRTTPLRGLWHPPQLVGPYFHDGSARTLDAAVSHYVRLFGLPLTERDRSDLVAYLKTL
jgi:mono/diheme cytochrome c family protein